MNGILKKGKNSHEESWELERRFKDGPWVSQLR